MTAHTDVTISASVDWLTVTATEAEASKFLYAAAQEIIEARRAAGFAMKRKNILGYQALVGGGVVAGASPQGVMLVLSGASANKYGYDILETKPKVTRLDLAITCWLETDPGDEVRRAWRHVVELQGADARNRIRYVDSNARGNTLYLGSRQSERMGRLYDKWRESRLDNEFFKALRYEVELKSRTAMSLASQISETDKREDLIASYVFAFFNERGIIPLYAPGGEYRAIAVGRQKGDVVSKVKWLEKSVHPVYKQCLLAGVGEIALQAIITGIGAFDTKEKEKC